MNYYYYYYVFDEQFLFVGSKQQINLARDDEALPHSDTDELVPVLPSLVVVAATAAAPAAAAAAPAAAAVAA